MSGRARGYAANRLVLELDDGAGYVGTLQSAEGGDQCLERVEHRLPGRAEPLRMAGRPRYEDVTIQVGMSMAPRFWSWLRQSFQREPERRDGAIVALDYNNRKRWRRSFERALITEVCFPALDSAAKGPAYLTVKLAVERMEQRPDQGPYEADRESNGEWAQQVQWLPSSFTFKVDQFREQALRSTRIEPFAVRQRVIPCPSGNRWEVPKEPGLLELPTLQVTMLEADAGPWMEWHRKLRDGEYGPGSERTGHIAFLPRAGDRRRPLMTLDVHGMGIERLRTERFDAAQPQLGKVRIDLFCGAMDLRPEGRTAAA